MTVAVCSSEFCVQVDAAHVFVQELLSKSWPPDKIHAENHRAALASLRERSSSTTQRYGFSMGNRTLRLELR
ncbi:Ureidoglycolate lyase [Fusarium oxysporum f. sp. albedinis]|nr:Ureidoglycolate lyase [Fusarium oxysporum f. sp. albedinis]